MNRPTYTYILHCTRTRTRGRALQSSAHGYTQPLSRGRLEAAGAASSDASIASCYTNLPTSLMTRRRIIRQLSRLWRRTCWPGPRNFDPTRTLCARPFIYARSYASCGCVYGSLSTASKLRTDCFPCLLRLYSDGFLVNSLRTSHQTRGCNEASTFDSRAILATVVPSVSMCTRASPRCLYRICSTREEELFLASAYYQSTRERSLRCNYLHALAVN